MKPWEYYETGVIEPDGRAYLKKLHEEIYAKRLSRHECRAALDSAAEQSKEWVRANTHNLGRGRKDLREEFWADAREELGYGWLPPAAIARIESMAEERASRDSYEGGYAGIFSVLEDLVEIVNLVRHL